MTALSLLAVQLTSKNCDEWIRSARHKTAEEIKRLLADRQPKPDVAVCVRRIPSAEQPSKAPTVAKASGAARMESPREPVPAATAPLGGERYRVSFTADGELHAQLQELRALMRHQIPDRDLASILGRAVAVLLDQVRKRKFAGVAAPKPAPHVNERPSLEIPAAIRRAVALRDGERCTYVSASGRKCGAREFLEFHHLEPWARTRTHTVDGITLRCRAHNQHAACHDFGEVQMARFRKPCQERPV